ncbi:MAG: hypothetical protein HFJ35_02630 [Clostridia bacterium]|nr:hypothetical protein [Clostridia bacterium]
MSKADEMFKELGYKKNHTQLGDIEYYKDDDNVIYFYLAYKKFNKSGEYDGMCDYITMQELQVINEKVKELGWLDE